MAFRMRWPTRQGIITRRFGEDPQRYDKFGLPGHEGLDFAAPAGSEVTAVADGLVSDVRLDGSSDPMVKPYGHQIRIQHAEGYQTLYAHLSQVVVVRGQLVQAQQVIALAGSTGYTGVPHLHLGLKKAGATVNGETDYPYDLVDPEPYLLPFGDAGIVEPDIPEPTGEVVVTEAAVPLNIHALPAAGSDVVASVTSGTCLGTLEPPEVVCAKAGRAGQWLWVRTPEGRVGWIAAQHVTLPEALRGCADDEPALLVMVNSDGAGFRLRAGPSAESADLDSFPDGTFLRALENVAVVEERVGQQHAWLQVLAPTGQVGHGAAWHLQLPPFGHKPVLPLPTDRGAIACVVVEAPDLGLRLRAGPGTAHVKVWWVPDRTVLTSLEDPAVTGRKVGQQDTWLHVRTPSRREGYVAAWFLRRPEREDDRSPAEAAAVRTGLSPHLFGFHLTSVADDPYGCERIRDLYDGMGKQGWVLFSEVCGRHARTITPVSQTRQRLWDWADRGYGVIIRLNYGYEPGGTLPESRFYDDFAAAAARWVALYLKDSDRSPADYTWTIQIGNEPNNPREHPGGLAHPVEHISAERYADAFNRTYARLKAVLPNAIVCPGAVDPYNYVPMPLLDNVRWRPLDYFETMMSRIEALDGIVLHAYTHGPDVSAITHLKCFGGGTGPLWDHYYDFQTYRLFMERIPARWRDVPIYMTEMNHIHRPAGEHDEGWINQNLGWIRAVYADIDQWNRTPHAQQIRCGLLYRWMGDAWTLADKPAMLEDFRQALAHDCRWRTPLPPAIFARSGTAAPVTPKELEERFLIRPDDLTLLCGVGVKAQAVLRAAGILTFEQLADLSPARLETLIGETGLRARLLATWSEQARLAAAGDLAGLSQMRERLTA